MQTKYYLGIDYGSQNIGIAIEQIGIAIPHSIIHTQDFFGNIRTIIEDKGITDIVIGHAIGYDIGGKQQKIFENFAQKLQKYIPAEIQIHFQDEDLSTFEAQIGLEKYGDKDHLDDVAASIILQRFLDTNQ